MEKYKTLDSEIIETIKSFNDKWKDNIYKNEPCDYHGLSCSISKIIRHYKQK